MFIIVQKYNDYLKKKETIILCIMNYKNNHNKPSNFIYSSTKQFYNAH